MPLRNPLVSIVVPAYNAERALRKSLDSLVGQTYPATQIVLMDDGSADGTEGIPRSSDDRIADHRQRRNRGQFANVSDGNSCARGEYVAVFHADDEYFPEIIARQAAFLQSHPEAGAVFAIEIFIDAEGRERGRLTLPGEMRGRELPDYRTVLNALLCYKSRIFCGPGSMIRVSVYRTIGPYRGEEFRIRSTACCGPTWSRTLRSWTNIWLRAGGHSQLRNRSPRTRRTAPRTQ